MTFTPVPHDDAHEIVAALFASLHGHHVTYHGDEFQVNGDPVILRDSHGWPVQAVITLADDTRGDSIRVTAPIQAAPLYGMGCHVPGCTIPDGHHAPHDIRTGVA